MIYIVGIFMLLGYIVFHFFTRSSHNQYVIHLSDPFAINSVQTIADGLTASEKNTLLIQPTGPYLVNRLVWTGIGIVILLYTWFRFSFERFFSPVRQKKTGATEIKRYYSPGAFSVGFGKK